MSKINVYIMLNTFLPYISNDKKDKTIAIVYYHIEFMNVFLIYIAGIYYYWLKSFALTWNRLQ